MTTWCTHRLGSHFELFSLVVNYCKRIVRRGVVKAMAYKQEKLDSKIIIRNYPPETTESDLRIMFEKYGKIDDCKW